MRYYFGAVEWTIAETATTEFYTSRGKGETGEVRSCTIAEGGGKCQILHIMRNNYIYSQILICRKVKLIKRRKVIEFDIFFATLL